jgi:hypothetical protein
MKQTTKLRAAARAQGAATYATGKTCHNGHDSPRYTATGLCVACKAAKDRRFVERYPNAKKDNAAAWYVANREQGLATRRAYHERRKGDPDYESVRKAYQVEHYDRLRNLQRAKNSTPEAKAAKAAKRKAEAHLYRGYEQKRRARLKGAVPPWFGELDELVLAEAAELCVRRAAAMGLPWEIDHMIPLLATRASGLHCASNVQVIPQWLNRTKNRRMILTQPREWLQRV